MKVKTTNALMKYLREEHNISIDGTKDKKNLRNIGYYNDNIFNLEKENSQIKAYYIEEKKLITLMMFMNMA